MAGEAGMVEGGCRCGLVRYRIATEAMPPVYCCHCLDCQTWSGSAFTEQAVVRAEALSATGPIVEYSFENRSGSRSTQWLCATCHARLWNTNTARPGIALVRAGTLDASDRIEPRAHIWVKRKQPWIALPDSIPAYEEGAPPAAFAAILAQ
ncbi:MAG: GFA family protein [Pseudomonadota bacterium]